MISIPIKVDEGGTLPTKGTEGSAGWDLYSPRGGKIYPGVKDPVHLAIRAELPEGYAFILTHRSGHHKVYGVSAYGLIDSDFRGPFIVHLTNHGQYPFIFEEGDRIAQMRLVEVPKARLVEVDKLNESERGEGGHGSTGR